MPGRHVADASRTSYLIENPTKHGRAICQECFMTTHRDRTRARKAEDLPEIDLEEKSQAKKRRCLICDAAFDSFGPGNRICPTCKSSARWKTGW
jgi:hypothetical protein